MRAGSNSSPRLRAQAQPGGEAERACAGPPAARLRLEGTQPVSSPRGGAPQLPPTPSLRPGGRGLRRSASASLVWCCRGSCWSRAVGSRSPSQRGRSRVGRLGAKPAREGRGGRGASAVGGLEEVSFYADLANLVIAMANEEINEKSYDPDPLILIYSNNVVSVMKMTKEAKDSNVACIVLNLFLKHSKAVVSDLIDFCMKNLHDLSGKVFTNIGFASSVKSTLFTLSSHKAAEIVQAMLDHFHSTLIVQKPGGDNLAYALVKAGSRTDAKAQN
ncbi:LOW QUALITY PROTEIN: A-kinase anchor protein 3 [Porphyrio hochstetteri]